MSALVSVIVVTYNRKDEVTRCLESIFKSNYDNFEIIVVDNGSTDGTADFLEQKYGSDINLIKSTENLMAGGGRNLGAEQAKGEYLLFVDSDNVIDTRMISELLGGMVKNADAGMVGPLMYFLSDPKTIFWAWADINLWTSKTSAKGFGELDEGQYNEEAKVGHIPNVFMVSAKIWGEVGGIDPEYVMHYEESDLAEKIKRAGKYIYRIPTAKTYHDVPLFKGKAVKGSDILRSYGLHDASRAYLVAKNRILFMKKNASFLQQIVFFLIFLPFFSVYYTFFILKSGEFTIVKSYLKGMIGGLL